MQVAPPPRHEFYWAPEQSALIIRKDGDIISVVLLGENTQEEAQRRAEALMGQLNISQG